MKTNCKPFFVHLERNMHHFIHCTRNFRCHCEERSDMAIPHIYAPCRDWPPGQSVREEALIRAVEDAGHYINR